MGTRFATLLPRLGFGAVVASAVVVPVAFTRLLADPFNLTKATWLWWAAIVAALGVAALFAGLGRSAVPRPRAAAPIALLVGWTGVAAILSDAPATALVGAHGRYDGLATVVACATVGLAVVALTWREPARLEWVAGAVVVGGVLGLAYVVLEQLGWEPIDWHLPGSSGAPIGLGGNPNFSGAHLAMAVPVVIAARRRLATPWPRRAAILLAVLLTAGVWWTGTRGGLVALAGGVAAVGLLVPEAMPKPVRVGAVAGTILLVLAIVVSGAFGAVPGPRKLESLAVLDSKGIDQRTYIWAGTVSMIEANPLLGVGPGGFGRAFAHHRPSRGGLSLISADEAHDIFLDRAATAGFPALAAQLWLLALVGVGTWRARRVLPEHLRWLLGAFGGMLVAYLLQGLVSIDAIALVLLSWLAIGSLLVLGDPAVVAAREPAAAEPRRRGGRGGAPAGPPAAAPAPVAVASVGVALVLGALAARPAVADHEHRLGQEALAASQPVRALRHDRTAASWLGREPEYQLAQAEDLVAYASTEGTDPALRRVLLDEAIVAYGAALERAPGDVGIQVARAQVQVLAAQAAASAEEAVQHLDAAEATFRSLLAELPAVDDLHLPYGRVLEVRAELGPGDREAEALASAAEQFDMARAYRPHEVDALIGLARVRVSQGLTGEARELLVEATDVGGDSPEVRAAIAELDRQIAASTPD